MMDNLQPIYRIEDFWYAIVNGLSCPHTPIYRIEQYLAYLCGADVEVPQPIYRIEQYLAYKCGLDVELPEPIYRQEMFLAKWCGMDVEPPTPIYRIEVLLSQLSNGYLHTETGNPISVSDALAKPAESLTIEILPQQDLHGYDNPWPAGGGKNKIGLSRTEGTPTPAGLLVTPRLMDTGKYYAGLRSDNYYYHNYVTSFSVTDTTVKVTSANNTRYGVAFPVACAASSQYTISATLTEAQISVGAYDASWNFLSQVIGPNSEPPLTITTPADAAYITIIISSQTLGVEGTATNIQLELGSTATTYAPYSNICPISGWSNVNVYREAQYDAGATPYATINLNGTVYGGTLDVTTGVLTIDRAYGTLDGTENWGGSSSEWYTDKHNMLRMEDYTNTLKSDTLQTVARGAVSQADFHITGYGASSSYVGQNWVYVKLDSTFTTGQAVKEWFAEHPTHYVYPLATPQTIQLTPTEIEMLLGNNVIWNDVGGDMVLEYLADGPADDIDALNILLNNRYVNNGEPDEATDKEALEILLGGNTR